MNKLLILLLIPLLAGCSPFRSAKYQFINPQTNEPMGNLSLTYSYGGLNTPIYPFILEFSNCKTDSNGVASLRGFSAASRVLISAELEEKKHPDEYLYIGQFRNGDLKPGDVLHKPEFIVKSISARTR